MKKIILIFSLFLVVEAAHAGKQLTSNELRSFYTNTTVTAVHFKHGPGKTYYGTDSRVHSKSKSGKERIGKWWIDEKANKRCIRWNHEQTTFCHYTERNSDGSHTLIHGKNGKRIVEIKSTQKGKHL